MYIRCKKVSVAKSKIYNKNKRNIDGVICIASDVPYTVAKIAESLSIPGISPKSALLVSNKYLMKTNFQKNNIPTPWFQIIKDITELKAQISSNKMPMVIKPVDSRGSRGVLLLDSSTNLDWAYKHAKVIHQMVIFCWNGSCRDHKLALNPLLWMALVIQ